MVTVTIDLSEAKVFLEEARREGGGRLRGLWEWSRGFAGRGLEGLLRIEGNTFQPKQRQGFSNFVFRHAGPRQAGDHLGQIDR